MKLLGVVVVVVVVVGVLSGAAGAWLVQRVMTREAAVVVTSQPEMLRAPAPTPTGWDPRLLSRVSALEARVSDMATRTADEPEAQQNPATSAKPRVSSNTTRSLRPIPLPWRSTRASR